MCAVSSQITKGVELEIGFAGGQPRKLNGQTLGFLPLVVELNRLGGEHAIGRSDVVEDREVEQPRAGLEQRPDQIDEERPGHDAIGHGARQVLRLAGEGLSTARIAGDLHLSEGTVRNYLSEAISKLGASNRIEAARIAREKGWL